MSQVILPGATLGILGSGQLGRMFALAARQMGYRIITFSPDKNTPAGQACDQEICAAYDDHAALLAFARQCDGVTLEFENIPASALEAIQGVVPLHPNPHALWVAQNRLREKTYLAQHGFPVVPFVPITTLADLTEGLSRLGVPAVLKTAGFGYDGKGQSRINHPDEAEAAFAGINGQEGILEAFVAFETELSVVAARNAQGEFAHYGTIENQHRNHILDISLAPGRFPAEITEQAVSITQALMTSLSLVGLLCVEFFLTPDGTLLINEIAPRPHNSGHLTIDAAMTSQFEQHVRAICGLPLGDTKFHSVAAMANLLGDLWHYGKPNWQAALAIPGVKLHLYGKQEARPGRKMGHLTALGTTVEDTLAAVVQARTVLTPNHTPLPAATSQ